MIDKSERPDVTPCILTVRAMGSDGAYKLIISTMARDKHPISSEVLITDADNSSLFTVTTDNRGLKEFDVSFKTWDCLYIVCLAALPHVECKLLLSGNQSKPPMFSKPIEGAGFWGNLMRDVPPEQKEYRNRLAAKKRRNIEGYTVGSLLVSSCE